MIGRIDQQIRVNKLMADAFHNCQFDSKHLKKYMLSYLDIITTVSSIMLVRAGTQEALDKKKECWSIFVNRISGCIITALQYSGTCSQSSGQRWTQNVCSCLQSMSEILWIQLKNFPFMGKFFALQKLLL